MSVLNPCGCDVPVSDSIAACEAAEYPHIDPMEFLKESIRLYLQFDPLMELDRVEFNYQHGITTATPIYRPRMLEHA